MAATDLCSEILKQNTGVQLEEGMEKKICTALIAHLNDKSLDVQGNAVRCIQKISSRIREKHLIMIIEVMADIVVSGEKETRDIYSLAIRGIIGEISDENAASMIKAVYPKLMAGFGNAKSEDVREECVDILAQIFKRFNILLLKRDDLVKKDELMLTIPNQLAFQKPSLRKKATNCMGAFAVILNGRQLSLCLKVLIDKIKDPKSKQDMFTQIQCFSQMARNIGNRLTKDNIKDVLPVLLNQASSVLREQKSVDQDNEIAEASLFAIESVVRRCPREIDQYIQDILDLSIKLLSFDPNYTYPLEDEDEKAGFMEDEGEGWGSDFEDENMGNEDDDDSSWKVRRASAKLIDGIFSARPDMLRDLYRKYGDLLSSRFKERDINVKCNILETFHTVLKTAIHSEQNQGLDFELSIVPSLARAKSSADELHNFVPQIINRIVKQLKESKNGKVKIALMDTLAQLSHVMVNQVAPHFGKILPELEKISNDASSYELIMDTLTVMRRLFKTQDAMNLSYFQEFYQKIQAIILRAIAHDYQKVVSEALRVAGIFVNIIKGPNGLVDPRFAAVVQPLYAAIR